MRGLLFRLFGKKENRASKQVPKRARLGIEMLESRDCPSTFGGGSGDGGSSTGSGAPLITLVAQVQPDHEVQLSGTVTDSNPAGVAVAFSGAVTDSTTTDAYGNFSLTTAAASLGAVYASGTDQLGQTTNTASATIATAAPAVTLVVTAVGPSAVSFSGTLTGVDNAGQTITLSGAVNDTAVTDGNGNFTYVTSSSVVGEVDVSITDLWGQSSNVGAAIVPAYITPAITLNAVVLPGHQVQLSGSVADIQPAGVSVAFSGAVNDTITTDADGNFSFTTTDASLGTVNAVGTDAQQYSTNTATATIATAAPVVTLAGDGVAPNNVTLSGTLTGVDSAYQTITISGAVNDTAVTDADGNFTYTTGAPVGGVIDASITDLWGQSANVAAVSFPGAITLNAVVLPDHQVQLSGTVTDNQPAYATVTFTGAVNTTTTTDSNGNFTFDTNPASLGAVFAVGTDALQINTNTASATIATAAPVVTLAAARTGPDAVVLSGTLAGVDSAYQTITLSGAVQESVATDANGNFTYTTNTSVFAAVDASCTDLWGQSSNVAEVFIPGSITLNALVLAGQQVQLSGTLSDYQPAYATVTFTGAVNATTTTDAFGNFTLTTSQASLGAVNAVGTDSLQISSNTASATIATDAPVVTLAIVAIGPNFDALSGTLSGVDNAGQTITLSGAVNDSVVTDANGNFTYLTSSLVTGAFEASTTDLWGQASNTAEVDLAGYTAPAITLSAQVLPGGQVQLSGTVTDEDAEGVTVTFSGAYFGSTTTDGDGNFCITTSQATLGTVFAVGQDQDLQLTNAASTSIAVAAPVLTLAVTGATADTVTLSGTLTGMDCSGQTVTLSGAVEDSAVTDGNGNFTITEDVSAGGTIQAVTVDPWGQSSNTPDVTVQSMTDDGAPQLSLDVLVLPGRQVQLTGSVIGDQPAGITVTFSGAVTGTTTTDANGFFSFWATATSTGTVSAVGVDPNQQSTNTASADITVNAPTITLAASSSYQGTVTYTGKLTDIDAAGETINITGASVSSVVTDANGNFSFTCAAAGLGEVDVSATDFWGETSNTAAVNVAAAPVITNFSAVKSTSQLYFLEGDVIAANAPGLTVVFGGLTSITGLTTIVASDSSFEKAAFLTADDTGTATAQTSAFQGVPVSNLAQAIVR